MGPKYILLSSSYLFFTICMYSTMLHVMFYRLLYRALEFLYKRVPIIYLSPLLLIPSLCMSTVIADEVSEFEVIFNLFSAVLYEKH